MMKMKIQNNMIVILVFVLTFHCLTLSFETNRNNMTVKNRMSEHSSIMVQPPGLNMQHPVLSKNKYRNSEILSYMILPPSVILFYTRFIRHYEWKEGEQAGFPPCVIQYIQKQDGKKK